MDNPAISFFNEIPDEMLVYLAEHDRSELLKVCNALTLDLYLIEEDLKKQKNKNIC